MSRGMPPNRLPNNTGKPVFERSPMPSMPKPIVTNTPKNGIAMKYGMLSPLLSLSFAISSGVNTWCCSTISTRRVTPARMPPE
ncbi:hypothetical protein D3C83_61350 [compost metagenome]